MESSIDVRNGVNKEEKAVPFEEALSLTGFGKYNIFVLCVAMIIALALGLDLFGSALVIPASSCDLELTVEQRGILGAVPFIGAIVTAHLWGYLSDFKGRKYVLFISMFFSFLLSFASSFSPNWIVMAVLKVFAICFSSASNALVFTLVAESCPQEWRGRLMLLVNTAFMSLQTVNGILAYFILKLDFRIPIAFLGIVYRPWRLLVQSLAIFNGIGAIGILLVHETPKFLASYGRNEDALNVLRSMYAKNTGDLPENYPVKDLQFDELHEKKAEHVSFLRSSWQHTIPLFKPPLLKKTLKLYFLSAVIFSTISSFFIWLSYILNGYFDAVANNVKDQNLCGLMESSYSSANTKNDTLIQQECDDTINDFTILTAAVLCIILMVVSLVISFFPKKKLMVMGIFILGGVCGLLTNLVYHPAVALISFIMFLWMCTISGVVSAYFAELFPTNVRGMASCLGVMVFRLSSCTGTYTMGLLIQQYCPVMFYGTSVLAFICAWVIFTLPEIAPRKTINRD